MKRLGWLLVLLVLGVMCAVTPAHAEYCAYSGPMYIDWQWYSWEDTVNYCWGNWQTAQWCWMQCYTGWQDPWYYLATRGDGGVIETVVDIDGNVATVLEGPDGSVTVTVTGPSGAPIAQTTYDNPGIVPDDTVVGALAAQGGYSWGGDPTNFANPADYSDGSTSSTSDPDGPPADQGPGSECCGP